MTSRVSISLPLSSFVVKVTLKSPALVGVPVILPSLKVRPSGNLPPVSSGFTPTAVTEIGPIASPTVPLTVPSTVPLTVPSIRVMP